MNPNDLCDGDLLIELFMLQIHNEMEPLLFHTLKLILEMGETTWVSRQPAWSFSAGFVLSKSLAIECNVIHSVFTKNHLTLLVPGVARQWSGLMTLQRALAHHPRSSSILLLKPPPCCWNSGLNASAIAVRALSASPCTSEAFRHIGRTTKMSWWLERSNNP